MIVAPGVLFAGYGAGVSSDEIRLAPLPPALAGCSWANSGSKVLRRTVARSVSASACSRRSRSWASSVRLCEVLPSGVQTLSVLAPAHLQRLAFGRRQAQRIELALLRLDGLAQLRHLLFQSSVTLQPLAVFPVELHQIMVLGGQRLVGLAQADL